MTLKRIVYQCDLCDSEYEGDKDFIDKTRNFVGFPMLHDGEFAGRQGYELEHICPICNARLDALKYDEARKIQKENSQQRTNAAKKLKTEIKRREKAEDERRGKSMRALEKAQRK